MKSDDFQNQFSKAVLTAVFVGFITTIVCLGYNIFYREETGLIPSELINVSTLIFGVNLFFFISGMIYYVFRKASKRGDILFVVVFSLLTIFLAWKAEGVNRTTDHETSLQFRGLLLGIILIAGVAVSFVVPFLFHNRKFNKSVL
ncbi:MAG: hypothetical protein JJE22_10025 [Bacteroidia bacterium]|nr:hypothetical protein [Bacteroidia bacterium]